MSFAAILSISNLTTRSRMFTMGCVLAFSFAFFYEASFTASALTDPSRFSSLSFVGLNPSAFMPLSKFVKNRRAGTFQPCMSDLLDEDDKSEESYMSDVLDEDNKAEEMRMDTAASNEKESVQLTNDAVKLANDAVKSANDAVAFAFEGVMKAQIELDQWNERVNSTLSDPDLLSVYVIERDKASERLDKASERLDKASERLDKAREYCLQLTQNVLPVTVSKEVVWEAKARASKFSATIEQKDVAEDVSDSDEMMVRRTNATASELETDAIAKAQDAVDYYSLKVKEFESKVDFTGKETQYIALRERLKEATVYSLELRKNVLPLTVSNEAMSKATLRARNFIATLMKEDALEDIPGSYGMKVMRNIPDLETALIHYGVRDIVIRNTTDKFWQACIERVATIGYRVCAVGTPGIGKTATTPYLIRMLLKRGKTVVYLFRSPDKKKWYYEFTPTSDNTVDVAVYPEESHSGKIPTLDDNSAYYIVDPGETRDTCVTDIAAKFILVSSPLQGHWGGRGFRKERNGVRGVFLYFPLWTLEELKIASNILGKNLTDEEIYERYRQFGGVPRAVLQPKRYIFTAELAEQDDALDSITEGMAESVFYRKIIAVDSFGSKTRSALIGFDLSESDNFESGSTAIRSAVVYEKVCNKYMMNLWNRIISDKERGGTLFEAYTRLQMSLPNQRRDFVARSCVGVDDDLYKETGFVRLGGCKSIRTAVDIVDAAKKSQGDLFHSIDKANPLIDSIYQDENGIYHAFQATVGKDHDAITHQIENLENQIEDAENNLRLYYLVPGENFGKFVTTPVNPDVFCRIYHVLIPKPGEEKLPQPGEEEDLNAL